MKTSRTSIILLMAWGLLSADVAQGQVQCDEVGNVADFSADHRVSLEDFVILAKYWLDGCSGPNWCEESDLDNSGSVDANDFAHFSSNWLWPRLIQWLLSQQDLDTGLVESYEDNENNFAYTFDQPMGIVAFTESGNTHQARRVLNRMEELQLSNGAWNEWYCAPVSCDVGWGSEKYVSGPIAWMVIAINFYECRTGDPNYAPMARKALSWLDTVMHKENPSDRRYGSLRWCEGPHCSADAKTWISTEHNIDAYSAYRWRGIMDANDLYLTNANLIMDYLCREMWAPTPGSNCSRDANVFCRGYNDSVVATDCQSWGVLSLGREGPNGEQFYESLDWLWDSDDSTRNQQDYCSELNVDGFKPEDDDLDFIWVDGTEHIVAAYYSIGDPNNRGAYFHNQMGRTISSNGSLIHSFRQDNPGDTTWNQEHNNYRYNYVASVAWYYFNERGINPFKPNSCAAK
jgi:hypothetical protein